LGNDSLKEFGGVGDPLALMARKNWGVLISKNVFELLKLNFFWSIAIDLGQVAIYKVIVSFVKGMN
jgi:hypothetical protein